MRVLFLSGRRHARNSAGLPYGFRPGGFKPLPDLYRHTAYSVVIDILWNDLPFLRSLPFHFFLLLVYIALVLDPDFHLLFADCLLPPRPGQNSSDERRVVKE